MERNLMTGTVVTDGGYRGLRSPGGGLERDGFRLTRRGRLVTRFLGWCGATSVAAVAVVSLVLTVSAVIAPGAQAGDGSVDAPTQVTVTVGPGESLWSLAVQHQPERDPRQVVIDIERLNGLAAGSMLQVGTRLQVPTT